MWPFRRKPAIDADTAIWIIDNFAWLMRAFGRDGFAESKLILPLPQFFPIERESGHALALQLFAQMKEHCGMAEWDVDLVEDDNPMARDMPTGPVMEASQKHALGMFMTEGNAAQISYVPKLLQRPEEFIATMAHELAHYLLATATEPPPCEDDEIEFLTDLTAVYLGFGVFLANTRFRFEPIEDGPMAGWRMGHSGYLPENDLIFALSLFIRLKQLDPAEACACLKPHLASLLRKALRSQGALDAEIVALEDYR
jgi:hypothetical protein